MRDLLGVSTTNALYNCYPSSYVNLAVYLANSVGNITLLIYSYCVGTALNSYIHPSRLGLQYLRHARCGEHFIEFYFNYMIYLVCMDEKTFISAHEPDLFTMEII